MRALNSRLYNLTKHELGFLGKAKLYTAGVTLSPSSFVTRFSLTAAGAYPDPERAVGS